MIYLRGKCHYGPRNVGGEDVGIDLSFVNKYLVEWVYNSLEKTATNEEWGMLSVGPKEFVQTVRIGRERIGRWGQGKIVFHAACRGKVVM